MKDESTVKRLTKSRQNRVIDGVCGGVGEYLGIDPVIVRIIFVASLLLGGLGAVLYIALMIIMPSGKGRAAEARPSEPAADEAGKGRPVKTRALKSRITEPPPPPPDETAETGQAGGRGALIGGILLIALGSILLMKDLGFGIWRFWWGAPWDVTLSLLLIGAGVAFIVTGRRSSPEPGESAGPASPPARSSRLTRPRGNRKIFGVCGGIAEYINVDPTVVRILFVVGGLVSFGFMILLYLLMAIVVPSDDRQPVQAMA